MVRLNGAIEWGRLLQEYCKKVAGKDRPTLCVEIGINGEQQTINSINSDQQRSTAINTDQHRSTVMAGEVVAIDLTLGVHQRALDRQSTIFVIDRDPKFEIPST
jgi:hypothetical protein